MKSEKNHKNNHKNNSMDMITDRIQKEDNMNAIYYDPEKGPGGGYHEYMICNMRTGKPLATVTFQKGPRKELYSVEGVLDVDLLEIVRHRLSSFMDGELKNKETEAAIQFVEYALMCLENRRKDRKARGVFGTMEK